MDIFDQATQREEQFREQALKAQLLRGRRQLSVEGPVGFCVECEDDLPPARQALGLTVCVDCATATERRGKLFAW